MFTVGVVKEEPLLLQGNLVSEHPSPQFSEGGKCTTQKMSIRLIRCCRHSFDITAFKCTSTQVGIWHKANNHKPSTGSRVGAVWQLLGQV